MMSGFFCQAMSVVFHYCYLRRQARWKLLCLLLNRMFVETDFLPYNIVACLCIKDCSLLLKNKYLHFLAK